MENNKNIFLLETQPPLGGLKLNNNELFYNENIQNKIDNFNLKSLQTVNSLLSRPPCRWEKHKIFVNIENNKMNDNNNNIIITENIVNKYNDKNILEQAQFEVSSQVEVEIILDIGHNPAAVEALCRRIEHELNGRKIRLNFLLIDSG
jgi:folylpolyglutamate synthase/dihydropteroate synthase